jgi:anaerobic selenocysteine-containing dehydrogenase
LGNYFIYRQKCVDPPGEIKTNEWIWVQIAKRLGIAELVYPRLAHVPEDKWNEAIEDLHREAYEEWALRKEIKPLDPPSWEEFQKRPVFRWEIKDPHYAFKKESSGLDFSFAPVDLSSTSPEHKPLNNSEEILTGTESGKIEFYSKTLAKGPAYLAAHEFIPGSGKCYGGGNLPAMAQMTLGGKDSFFS